MDWWSLGVVAYEMMMGFPPFVEKTQEKLFKKANPTLATPWLYHTATVHRQVLECPLGIPLGYPISDRAKSSPLPFFIFSTRLLAHAVKVCQ